MTIRKCTYDDMPRLMEIFSEARQTMRESGNLTQWPDTYPSEEILINDIDMGYSHALCSEDGKIQGTFALIPGTDPTYSEIYDGKWPDNDDYFVIHRIAASRNSGGGAARASFRRAFEISGTVRIDTHKDNVIMRHILEKYGFVRCGIIHLPNGSPREAYIGKRR